MANKRHLSGQYIGLANFIFILSTILLHHCHGDEKVKTELDNMNLFKDFILRRGSRKFVRRSVGNVEEIPIWSHSCIIKPHGFNSKSVIYECIPFLINTRVTMVPDIMPVARVPQTENTNVSISTIKPRHTYKLLDAIIQYNVPKNVTELRLWFQKIISIQKNAFTELKMLRTLNLQHNRISFLAKESFRGLSKLTELDLSYNRLRVVPNFVFKNLKNLEVLKLHHNKISAIQNSMLCGLSGSLSLDLSHNAIEDIEPYALRHVFKSSNHFFIELGYNKLARPRKEWLLRQSESVTQNDPLCDETSAAEKKILATVLGKSLTNSEHEEASTKKEKGRTQHPGAPQTETNGLRPVGFFRAAHNPWQCECDSDFRVIQFLRLHKSIITSEFNGGKVHDNDAVFQYTNNKNTLTESEDFHDVPVNKSDPNEYIRWYFTMPCLNDMFSDLDLGRLSKSEQNAIESTCCGHLQSSEFGKKIFENDENLKNLCKEFENGTDEFDDNHVTVIGIFIVFCTPMLLTLCPDCNKKVIPSSASERIMAAGKFGGGAVSNNTDNNNNNNNNSNRRTLPKYTLSKDVILKRIPSPSGSPRFCLVMQTDKLRPQNKSSTL